MDCGGIGGEDGGDGVCGCHMHMVSTFWPYCLRFRFVKSHVLFLRHCFCSSHLLHWYSHLSGERVSVNRQVRAKVNYFNELSH